MGRNTDAVIKFNFAKKTREAFARRFNVPLESLIISAQPLGRNGKPYTPPKPPEFDWQYNLARFSHVLEILGCDSPSEIVVGDQHQNKESLVWEVRWVIPQRHIPIEDDRVTINRILECCCYHYNGLMGYRVFSSQKRQEAEIYIAGLQAHAKPDRMDSVVDLAYVCDEMITKIKTNKYNFSFTPTQALV